MMYRSFNNIKIINLEGVFMTWFEYKYYHRLIGSIFQNKIKIIIGLVITTIGIILFLNRKIINQLIKGK
jgi:hypothetical protein